MLRVIAAVKPFMFRVNMGLLKYKGSLNFEKTNKQP